MYVYNLFSVYQSMYYSRVQQVVSEINKILSQEQARVCVCVCVCVCDALTITAALLNHYTASTNTDTFKVYISIMHAHTCV